ncbi:transglycosylase SLT domain-containing protein [Azospirillum sp. SYSU D00513]|uniref:transglycosylase SLT domain-containing protein n=1 Tax=Azospirillum sp. SYSU D00513 TaxID=2812561 RepID=UPI001A97552B|nr:transglycosylase SLT domain-containing protein [Azospirillum sp. SYSU D00513]
MTHFRILYQGDRSPFSVAKRCFAKAVVATSLAAASLQPGEAWSLDLAGTAWETAAVGQGIDPYLLFSVALVESGKFEQRYARPWPFALNSPSGNFYGRNRTEAEQRLASLPVAERKRTAVGMMQIYVSAHAHRVTNLSDLLDPATNLRLGASILREGIASKPGDLEWGIGRYNAWQVENEPVARKYGRRVLKVYQKLKRLSGRDGLSVASLWN